MQKKASILFFTLTLMLIILTVTLIMSALFHVQTETLVRAKEGSNALSAAQAGVEAARNSFAGKLNATNCNGARRSGTVIASFITYGTVVDTTYNVNYWYICTGDGTVALPFTLHSYEITSTGTFRETVRTSVVRGSWGQYIARWDMNEGRDQKVWDISRRNNHGTRGPTTAAEPSDPTWAVDHLSFDGVDDFVNAGGGTTLNFGHPVTLETWIFPTNNVGLRTIVSRSPALHQANWIMRNDAGRLSFQFGTGTVWRTHTTATAIITLNEWQHVVTVYDGATVRMYRNGLGVYSAAETIAPWTGTANAFIGAIQQGPGEFFHGRVDSVCIYNRALTTQEVLASFNRGR